MIQPRMSPGLMSSKPGLSPSRSGGASCPSLTNTMPGVSPISLAARTDQNTPFATSLELPQRMRPSIWSSEAIRSP